jgi:hypothetical protein
MAADLASLASKIAASGYLKYGSGNDEFRDCAFVLPA